MPSNRYMNLYHLVPNNHEATRGLTVYKLEPKERVAVSDQGQKCVVVMPYALVREWCMEHNMRVISDLEDDDQ